jgi:hypothetical protein
MIEIKRINDEHVITKSIMRIDKITIQILKQILINKNERILHMKSDNGYIRSLSLFLLKKDIKKYDKITIERTYIDVWSSYVFVVFTYIDGIICDIFKYPM